MYVPTKLSLRFRLASLSAHSKREPAGCRLFVVSLLYLPLQIISNIKAALHLTMTVIWLLTICPEGYVQRHILLRHRTLSCRIIYACHIPDTTHAKCTSTFILSVFRLSRFTQAVNVFQSRFTFTRPVQHMRRPD